MSGPAAAVSVFDGKRSPDPEQFCVRIVVSEIGEMAGLPSGSNSEPAMCEKCLELDKRIKQFRRLSGSINDRLTVERFEALIKNLEQEKAGLHPEPNEPKE